MKKLMLATAALVSLAGSAYAADMPVKARPVVVVDPGWEGFYIGGNAGYSWGRARTDQRDVITSSSITNCFRDPITTTAETGALSIHHLRSEHHDRVPDCYPGGINNGSHDRHG